MGYRFARSAMIVGLAFVLCSAPIAGLGADSEARFAARPFTAADSISMTRIVEPNAFRSTLLGATPAFKFSPDGAAVVIVTRSGDLQSGYNKFQLTLYQTQAIMDFLADDNAAGQPSFPEGTILTQFSSDSNKYDDNDIFFGIRWLPGSRKIVFVGQSSQIYIVDTVTGGLNQLTDHPRPIVSFDISDSLGTLIYAATVPHFRESRGEPTYLMGTNSIFDVLSFDEEVKYPPQYQYYSLKPFHQDSGRPLGQPFIREYPPETWLSPNGRWAITTMAPKNDEPSAWMENYQPLANHWFLKNIAGSFDENTMAPTNRRFFQYALIDLESETISPIFDAPTGMWSAGFVIDAAWLPGGKSVVLANTFLPLDISDPQELKRRRQSPTMVEFNPNTNEIIRIADHVVPEQGYEATDQYAAMAISSDARVLVTKTRNRVPLPPLVYEKRADRWVNVAKRSESGSKRLALSIQQDLNTPPDIFALDTETEIEKQITELNPQFKQLNFGRVSVFNWSDTTGRDWLGGLVYPPDFVDGQRYPLVVQTHGFLENQFLIDGPVGATGAYAAQALANRGIMVLQMPDVAGIADAKRREVQRLGVEAAIDRLNGEGLIDPRLIGAVGFSFTGHVVQHWITFSDYHFAAATIADAYSISYSGYISSYGVVAPGMLLTEGIYDGAVPWGKTRSEWVRLNPALNLDQVKTPLRLEEYTGLIQWWDVYTILRRLAKPVEWIVIPDGEHNLVKPFDRYVSLQGNVDWFDFWLNDRKRTEPYPGTPETEESLEEQYKRWRIFREQQSKSEIEATKARQWHKEQETKREQYEQSLSERAANDNAANTIDVVNQ